MTDSDLEEAMSWQTRVWDRMSQVYREEVDSRFEPVVSELMARARLREGERVLDLGTGTGAVAELAAQVVGPAGRVVGVDISPEMLALAADRSGRAELRFEVAEGSAEAIPAADGAFDVVLASLSLMFVIDRPAAAAEIARVLRPDGRLVASVWGGPDVNDLVRFQNTVGRFAPAPPVSGVGPGALADPSPFLAELAAAGIEPQVEAAILGFEMPNLTTAWEIFAAVTAASIPPERHREAIEAIQDEMWPNPDDARSFSNLVQFILGARA